MNGKTAIAVTAIICASFVMSVALICFTTIETTFHDVEMEEAKSSVNYWRGVGITLRENPNLHKGDNDVDRDRTLPTNK